MKNYFYNAATNPVTLIARFPRIANVPRRDLEDLLQAVDDAEQAESDDDRTAALGRIKHILSFHTNDEWHALQVEHKIQGIA